MHRLAIHTGLVHTERNVIDLGVMMANGEKNKVPLSAFQQQCFYVRNRGRITGTLTVPKQKIIVESPHHQRWNSRARHGLLK